MAGRKHRKSCRSLDLQLRQPQRTGPGWRADGKL
jgi:hypothetical protein